MSQTQTTFDAATAGKNLFGVGHDPATWKVAQHFPLSRHDSLAELAVPDEALRWHAIWTGEVALDPEARPAETLETVRGAIASLGSLFEAWEATPQLVVSPADRDSEILGRAVAMSRGLPFEPASSAPEDLGALDVLTVVWDLTALSDSARHGLKRSAAGHILYAHLGRCDTEAPVSADVLGTLGPRLAQRRRYLAPWGHDFESFALAGEPTPPRDRRPLEDIAREVLAAPARPLPDPRWARVLRPPTRGAGPPIRERGRRWRHPAQ